MKSIRGRKAFTMIELIIVIVILGILAGIAIVGYGAVVDRSEEASVEQAAASFDREVRALAAFDQIDTAAGLEILALGTEIAADLPDGVSVANDDLDAAGVVVLTAPKGTATVTFTDGSTPATIAVN